MFIQAHRLAKRIRLTRSFLFLSARTIRSISCHTFAGNQRSDNVKRSSTEQQVHPGIHAFTLHSKISSSDLRENALYLTEVLTVPAAKNLHVSTLSLDSIERDHHDPLDLFLYDSLNDESSDDDNGQFYDCSDDTLLLRTIANERQLIEQLTRRCSSLDSLDHHDRILPACSKAFGMVCARFERISQAVAEHARNVVVGYAPFLVFIACSNCPNRVLTCSPVFIEPAINGRMISPLRSATPVLNGNGNTRPTSPVSSSPLRHTIGATSAGNNIHSRDASREREREPLDYTDLEGNDLSQPHRRYSCFCFV